MVALELPSSSIATFLQNVFTGDPSQRLATANSKETSSVEFTVDVALNRIINAQDDPVVLVGHSCGGLHGRLPGALGT
jgi:predicted alpha/beta hydrolase family esterase